MIDGHTCPEVNFELKAHFQLIIYKREMLKILSFLQLLHRGYTLLINVKMPTNETGDCAFKMPNGHFSVLLAMNEFMILAEKIDS